MQSLQSLLNDRAALQKLRENLQDLPKRWLSRNDQTEDYLLGSVHGDCNYHFAFRLEGGGYFQTGVLVASAESAPGGLPVALKCKWLRKVGDLPVEIPGVTSNMYQISADDVGTHICVEAQPADVDDGFYGTIFGEIGPFELDPATRRKLDNNLGLGNSKFSVMLSRSPGDATAGVSNFIINATADGVGVVPVQGGAEKSNKEAFVEYSADYPKVIIHPLDTTKFQLVLSESRAFHFVATSRTSRDLIALTIRCFHSKKYLSTQIILQSLLPVQPLAPGNAAVPSDPRTSGTGSDPRLDACIVLERLTKELNNAMQQKELSEKVLRNTNHEKRQLQEQLMETISGFTEVIEGLQDQFADGVGHVSAAVPVERLQEQLHEVNVQNQTLTADIQAGRQKLEKFQRARKTAEVSAASAGTIKRDVAQLKEERSFLQARLNELTGTTNTPKQRDQADQVHAHELKRLRQDVETLHNQKEDLRRRLQDADNERHELQENFLYVKGQLDKVQMRQAQAAASSSSDGSKEVQGARANVEAAIAERNRLSMRLEGTLREVEKEKAYHEQSLERVVRANARLMEEKDQAAKEVQRISQLYAESVEQINQTNQSGVFSMDPSSTYGGSPVADPEEISRLQAQIAQAAASIQQKENENESLKNRIRKLAVA